LAVVARAGTSNLFLTSFPHIPLFNFMKKPYNFSVRLTQRLRQVGLTALLAGGTMVGARAQGLYYTPLTSTNTTSTFADLGTAGTAIATTSTDDANSTAQDIGFSFSYNGVAFTQFVLNTNGFIRLGAAAPSAANMFLQNETATTNPVGVDPIASTDPADVNLLLPFNFDLESASATAVAEYRVATTGTAPNRVCTIQWKNVHDKAATNTAQLATVTFQIKLYETSNQVDFVYGAAAAATTGTVIGRYATIGLKSTGSAAGQALMVSKGSSQTPWSGATFVSGTTPRVFFRSTFLPDAGRTFRFTVAPANDAAVNIIYTLGKLPIPAALPHAVQASISNAGSQALTNLPVTLSVSGANTFTNVQTVASLAAGASTIVTFANLPSTLAPGLNNLLVSVPADAVNTNNVTTQQQTVSTTPTFSYVPTDQPSAFSAYGGGTAGLMFGVKYTTQTAAAVSAVNVYIGDASAVGRTVAGTVLSTAGAILARSADYVVQAADVSTYKTFTIAMPPTIAAGGSFLAGLQQVAYTGAAAYPVGIQQEIPGRPATYYTIPVAGGTPTDIATSNYRLMIEATTVTPATCAAVTGLTATSPTATGATLTFTDPSAASSFQILYGPVGFNPANTGNSVTATASPFTLTTLQPGNTYDVYVRTNCPGGGTSYVAGPVSVTTPCVNTATVSGFPYTESFEGVPSGQAVPCGITVLDANTDNVTWRVSTEYPNTGLRDMRYQSVTTTVAADDWFFTPALALAGTATRRYQVAFSYRAAGTGSTGTSNYTEALEVKSGTAATVAGQTNLLYTNNSITNLAYAQAGGSSGPVVAYLPTGTTTQYVGFHVKSAALQGNLYIDDLSVTAVTITGTSEALLRAVTVFPNPSATGVFNLAVSGANAQKGLEVEVVNNLGQRLYTTTARDNFTTTLDLSNLANGLYHLKVKNGSEYLVQQISVVK
jgi:hypothetical protein